MTYNAIARNIVLPIADKVLGTRIKPIFDRLQKTQWSSKEDIERYQIKKFRQLVDFSYKHIPFYHNHMRGEKIYPHDIKSLEDLRKFPVIDKKVINANSQDFINNNLKNVRHLPWATGGTTGHPLKFNVSLKAKSFHTAAKLRSQSWAGYNYGDRKVTIGGTSLVPNEKISFSSRLRKIGERNLSLPAMFLSKKYLDDNIGKIIAHNPDFVRGYPTAIFTLAKYVRDNKKSIKLKGVFTTAEMLLKGQRDLIENEFGCSVFDNYGCADGGGMANECEIHQGFHTAPEISIHEVLDDSCNPLGAHEEGNIVWTDLHNNATPFIRYAPGDLGTTHESRCSCGRSLPRLATIIGRTTDIIQFSNGRMLSGPAMTLIFKEFNILQYQLVKVNHKELKILLVPSPAFSDREYEEVNRIMAYHCGESVKVQINIVDNIKPNSGSKFKFIMEN